MNWTPIVRLLAPAFFGVVVGLFTAMVGVDYRVAIFAGTLFAMVLSFS